MPLAITGAAVRAWSSSSTATTSVPTRARPFATSSSCRCEDPSLRFVFRHFPLTEIHPHALASAGVAEAAAAQGLFWAMHELLFHRQKALGEDDLFAYAR